MGAVRKATLKGVTGGAGDWMGYGAVRPNANVREGGAKTPVLREPGKSAISGQIFADGDYCHLPRPQGRGQEATPERQAKGDVQWGAWTVIDLALQGGKWQLVPISDTGWHRADRLAPLLERKVITPAMKFAAERFADDAEAAEMVGLHCTFGAVKVDGRGAAIPVASGSMASERVRSAMALLGGSSSLMGGTVWLVVVCGISLNAVEGGWRWYGQPVSREELRGILRAGLDVLANYYLGDKARASPIDRVAATA